MPEVLIGIAVLVIVLIAVNGFTKADVKGLTRGARIGRGLAAMVRAASGAYSQRTRRQTSRVRSPFLEMELDHNTGTIRGYIISGVGAGTSLDALELSRLVALLSEFDPGSQALLVAYLDRRDPRWREHAQAGATAGQGAARSTGKMSENEAYKILGLEPGASRDEVSRAHHALMKKLHPDQGGSTYLAARVNEAKEVLTRRHR